MNSFQIDNQVIELVFQNTECVYVDIWAIEYFTTESTSHVRVARCQYLV